MKSYIKTLIIASGVLMSLTACDNVDIEDRYLPYTPDAIDAEKSLLVQEFTGMRCVNCPKGAQTIHDITEALGGNVVAVCIHPENHTFTEPINGLDLTSPASTELYNYYHPNFPAAIFDGSRPNSNVARWSGVAMTAYNQPTPVNIEVTTKYDAGSRKVTAHYKATFIEAYEGDLNVTLYLTEDGIIGEQESLNGETLYDYEFNHVLRAAFNTVWGETMGSSFHAYQIVEGDYDMTLDPKWVAENCNVVAFVGVNKGTVYNAAETPVTSK